MVIETKPWDVAEHLDSPEMIAAYLEAVLEEDDPKLLQAALGDIARARGMTAIAQEAGVTRDALYKGLSETGDPRLSTLMGVVKALGLHLSVRAS